MEVVIFLIYKQFEYDFDSSTVTDLNISVEWDTDMIFPYHFDTNHHQSNVVVCDEPRILQRENIAVGCLVERGYLS